MPWPCTMRTRLAVAITARSRNSSTASRASSARWPITLISWCTGASSGRRLVADVLRAACARRAAFGQHLDHVVDRDLHLHEAGFHFDAAVAQHAAHARGLADVLQAHAHALFDARAAVCGPGANRPGWRARWSGSPRAVRAWSWRRGAARPGRPCAGRRPATILPMVSCACSSNLRQRLIGAALQFLDLGGLALLPLARHFLLARGRARSILLAQARLRAPASLRCGGAVR